MKPFYFLFLSVVVAMGQTDKVPTVTVTMPIYATEQKVSGQNCILTPQDEVICSGSRQGQRVMWMEPLVLPTKATVTIEPAAPKLESAPGSSIPIPNAPLESTEPTWDWIKDIWQCPKGSSAYPVACVNNSDTARECKPLCVPDDAVIGDPPGSLNLDKPLGVGHGFDWQAIADHCHIETLVHHRSEEESWIAPDGPQPFMPKHPVPDTWEAVTGMRIVCK
jgi:hypothetical protein